MTHTQQTVADIDARIAALQSLRAGVLALNGSAVTQTEILPAAESPRLKRPHQRKVKPAARSVQTDDRASAWRGQPGVRAGEGDGGRGGPVVVAGPGDEGETMTAVEQFNELFRFHFGEPVDAHTRGVMIGFARDSGRADVAERLAAEAAGEIAPRCSPREITGAANSPDEAQTISRGESVTEHNAFPGGRW